MDKWWDLGLTFGYQTLAIKLLTDKRRGTRDRIDGGVWRPKENGRLRIRPESRLVCCDEGELVGPGCF